MPSHFEFHGSIIHDERRSILEAAKFDGFAIVQHEKTSDDSFDVSDANMPFVFLHEGQIYKFSTTHNGAIQSFFPLNMSLEKCLEGVFGRYFSISNQSFVPFSID